MEFKKELKILTNRFLVTVDVNLIAKDNMRVQKQLRLDCVFIKLHTLLERI